MRNPYYGLRPAFLAGGLIYCFAVVAQVSIFPSSPKQLETVRVQVPIGGLGNDQVGHPDSYSPDDTLITMQGGTITVSLLTVGNNGFELVNSAPVDLPIGQFPPGTYTVQVVRRGQGLGTSGPLGSTTFTVLARSQGMPLWDFTDLWWNPSESGWGVNLMQHPSGVIFVTWFVYGPDGKPIWYCIPDGTWASSTEYRGSIYRTTGPFYGGSFNPSAVTATVAGFGILKFDQHDYNQSALEFTVDGVTVTKQIYRQSF